MKKTINIEEMINGLLAHSNEIIENNGWENDVLWGNYNEDSLEYEMGYQRALKNLLFMIAK